MLSAMGDSSDDFDAAFEDSEAEAAEGADGSESKKDEPKDDITPDEDFSADWGAPPLEPPEFAEKKWVLVAQKGLKITALSLGIFAALSGISIGIYYAWEPTVEFFSSIGEDDPAEEKSEESTKEKTAAKEGATEEDKKSGGRPVLGEESEEETGDDDEEEELEPLVPVKVKIQMNRKAALWINDVKIGNTRKKTVELSEGEHVLRAIFGKKRRKKELYEIIEVQKGKTQKIIFDFKKNRVVVRGR